MIMGHKSAFIIKANRLNSKQEVLMIFSARAYASVWSTGTNYRALESPIFNLEGDYRGGRYHGDKVLGSLYLIVGYCTMTLKRLIQIHPNEKLLAVILHLYKAYSAHRIYYQYSLIVDQTNVLYLTLLTFSKTIYKQKGPRSYD
jgi:hypothetical protein